MWDNIIIEGLANEAPMFRWTVHADCPEGESAEVLNGPLDCALRFLNQNGYSISCIDSHLDDSGFLRRCLIAAVKIEEPKQSTPYFGID
jgi:hypothetical protein